MARLSGTRNRDYEASRGQLARVIASHLVRPNGEPASFAQLAREAGVSVPTLRHYFTDREGAIEAAMLAVLEDASGFLSMPPERGGSIEASLTTYLRRIVDTWRMYGLGRIFAGALCVSLQHDRHGPTFLTTLLEPVLQWIERAAEVHAARGEIVIASSRAFALALAAPIVLALLHQDHLRGTRCRPLDVNELISLHVRTLIEGVRVRP